VSRVESDEEFFEVKKVGGWFLLLNPREDMNF